MRTLRAVRRLHDDGWTVSVLTGKPSTYLPATPVDDALVDQVPPGVRIIRAGSVRAWDGIVRSLAGLSRRASTSGPSDRPAGAAQTVSSARRPRAGAMSLLAGAKDVVDAALSIPDRESGWLPSAWSAGAADQIRFGLPDVIYSSAPPWTGQLVAAGLGSLLRRPWVADFRDPWSRAPWRGERYRFAVRAARALERIVVGRADHVIFVTRANRDDFARQYGPASAARFHLIPNGCDPTEFEGLEPIAPASDTFVLLHAGSLYGGRSPVPLLNAIAGGVSRGVIDPNRFRLRFLGSTSLQTVDLPRVCRDLGIERLVEFLPRIPRRDGLLQMVSASCLLLLQPGHSISVPGKLYEYLATGRPILAIAEEGETADLVRSSGAGVCVPPDNERAIEDALVAAMKLAHAGIRPPARELFDGTIGAARIADLLEAVVAGREAAGRARLVAEKPVPGDQQPW
jgi:glycosyltransferase involved in cell wall biosynthesis